MNQKKNDAVDFNDEDDDDCDNTDENEYPKDLLTRNFFKKFDVILYLLENKQDG